MADDASKSGDFSRREFAAVTAAVGVSGLAASEAQAAVEVVATDVEVKTPDGICDAALFHPAGKGTWPAVLMWTDIFGLRPAFRDMGKRLAA